MKEHASGLGIAQQFGQSVRIGRKKVVTLDELLLQLMDLAEDRLGGVEVHGKNRCLTEHVGGSEYPYFLKLELRALVNALGLVDETASPESLEVDSHDEIWGWSYPRVWWT